MALSSSSPLPLLHTRQEHAGGGMASPLGSPETPQMSDREDNQTKGVPSRLIRQTSDILRSQHIDVKELRICVGTWNVGGICPLTDLDIQEWLDTEEVADIYVLGFQEIIPLEAGYMIGTEDNHPVAVWEHIIGETLNKKCLNKSSASHSKTCTNPTSASDEHKDKDFSRSRAPTKTTDHSQETCFEKFKYNLDESNNQNTSTKVLSHSKRLGMVWPTQPLDIFAHHLQDSAEPSVSARHLQPLDLACDLKIDHRIKSKRPQFVQIVSKQMVGVYLSIWVQKSLKKHIQNLRLSILGVGKTPYIGSKGSVSVSMSINQTLLCFVCCHLAAGEKDGDELKRNAHVEAIHGRTVFHPVSTANLPQRIYDHEKIIWLGDLNYRINLSYERTLELISKEDWDGLFEKDQLKKELGKGQTFDGWVEGPISFPPTYKYEFNSQKYVSDETKSGRRTPSWCDRILSYGKRIKLLSYKRAEITFSDHRPVSAVYNVAIEVLRHRKLQRALIVF